MVVNFEVGKTYKYLGKIGDPSPFISRYIDIQDALFIVSGKPLVCTYAENDLCPSTEFEGMSWEGGWRLKGCYHLFEEVPAPSSEVDLGKEIC